MSGYVPIGKKERQQMLADVGVDLNHLFDMIPAELRLVEREFQNLNAEGFSESEIFNQVTRLANQNKTVADYDSYLGAGYYDHYAPTAISHLLSRQEFLTAYTPYQAEISQGTLQAIFEWQSAICRLTGMDVSNSSMYDGASAAAEALLMACRATGRKTVFVAGGVNPETLGTIKTYFHSSGFSVVVGEVDEAGSGINMPDGEFGAYLIQNPNYYGIVEDIEAFSAKAHTNKALAVVSVDPVSLAVLKTPGEAGADIVVGEGQSLGLPLSYGGPSLGIFATTNKLMRKMPGRICGQTEDANGKTAYVLTIQAREQHIRREKATSNVCTSQALLATAATIYLALMGRSGLHEVASQSVAKAAYLEKQLVATGLFEPAFSGDFFYEFCLKPTGKVDLNKLNQALLERGILGGHIVEGDKWLLAVTETKSKHSMDVFVATVTELISGGKLE